MAFEKGALKDYNKDSSWQLQMNLSVVPILIEQLNYAETLATSSLSIADYGCSEGFNSMTILRMVLEEFRKHSKIPISVLHTDLPANNWSCFFQTINDSPNSYLELENVYYSTIGKTFYSQLAPPQSIHIGFSTFAFHYLSKISIREDEEVQIIYPKAGAQITQDLKLNITMRLSEIVTGGLLTIIVAGREVNSCTSLLNHYLKPIQKLFELGIITNEELNSFYWPTYHLDENEWKEVLDSFQDKIEVLMNQLTPSLCPFYVDYLSTGDMETYKQKLYGFIHVLERNPLMSCLKNRSDEEKQTIFARVKEEIFKNIEANESEPIFYYTTIVIKKLY